MQNRTIRMTVVCLFTVLLLSITQCSPGDRDPNYRFCLSNCIPEQRLTSSSSSSSSCVLLFPLPLLGWDCEAECRYKCMWQTEDERRGVTGKRLSPQQYYGKWPFKRLFGIQEPASVIFSIICFVAHFAYGNQAVNKLNGLGDRNNRLHWMHLPVRLFQLVSLNCWFWSVVYHTHDLDWTEKLDYSFAVLHLVVSTVVLCILDLPSKTRKEQFWLMLPSTLYLFFHAYVTGFGFSESFDYGRNIWWCCVISFFSFILISRICWRYRGEKWIWKGITFICLFTLGSFLELLDFPPIWDIFDAHSLWHFCGLPLIWLWYQFLADCCTHQAEHGFVKYKVFGD